jgi:hypothetical protein
MELAGAIEKRGNGRHAIGPVQRNLQRADRIPREVVPEREMHDPLMVPFGIERLDFEEHVEPAWPHHS